jgi:hypothetical protein
VKTRPEYAAGSGPEVAPVEAPATLAYLDPQQGDEPSDHDQLEPEEPNATNPPQRPRMRPTIAGVIGKSGVTVTQTTTGIKLG